MPLPAELGREGVATGSDTGTTPIDTGLLVNGVRLDIVNADGGTEVDVGREREVGGGRGGARPWSTEGRELAGEDIQCLRMAL